VEPTPEPTAAPTPEPSAEPSDTPTDVPAGEVADLCETFFDLPCSLGAGRYAPSRFSPAFDIELGDGWSTVAHQPDVVVLGRDEGLVTFLSGEIVIDPAGGSVTTRGRPRDIIEALVTLDGVSSTEPADIRIDQRRGVSIDVAPVGSSRIALLGTGGSAFYLEPDRTTRVLAVDVRGATLVMIIEPADGSDLRSIIETADPAAGTIRWR
ncbi:MAG: PT domain-containing protein, partial [Candidatus Limnocylindrales bacterium]